VTWNLKLETIKRHWGIVVILTAFFVLGITYSVTTPLFEAPDELQHYARIKQLAEALGLIQLDPAVSQLSHQQRYQQPLYHLVGTLATFWDDAGDMSKLLWFNPHADIGVAKADGNVNLLIHTSAEDFPYRGTSLGVHALRFLSVFMGTGTVLITYLIALEIFPQRQVLAVGAATVNAFIPQFLFISGAVNNDNLVTILSSIALWLLIPLIETPILRLGSVQVSMGRSVLIGVVVGLATLTKVNALGLLPLAVLVVAISSYRQRSIKVFVSRTGLLLAATALVAGWRFVRNWQLYGDPTALQMFLNTLAPRHPPPTLRQFIAEWGDYSQSFWGLFGLGNVPLETLAYRIPDVLALLGALGTLIFWIRVWPERKANDGGWMKTLVLLAWPVILFGSLMSWAIRILTSIGRFLFPAISALSILLFLGLSQFVPRRYTQMLTCLVGGLMFIIAAIVPFRYIGPAYAKPPLLSSEEIEKIPNRLNVSFGGVMKLLGYELETESAQPGDAFTLTLYWQSLVEMNEDYSVFIHLLGENELIVAQRDMYPGQGLYPTSLWSVGDTIANRYVLILPETVFTPNQAQLEVGLYDFATGERLMAYGPNGELLGDNARFQEISVLALAEGGIPNPMHVNFSDQIALVGYDLDHRKVEAGEDVSLTLYWQALAKMQEDYVVFVHLLLGADQIWARVDSQPLDGAAPTSTWQAGWIIEDRYELTTGQDTPPGAYQIEVGLYLPQAGKRLYILGSDGRLVGDRVLLSKVRVE
jgi:hypothetical protein